VVIAEADKMTIEASNSLLKILEEPPPEMYLILTTSLRQSMLPTIISRCQPIRFGMLTDHEIEQALITGKNVPADVARLVARIAQGNYGRALEWLEEDWVERRTNVIELLRAALRDPLAQCDFVDQLLAKYDKRVIKDLLNLALIWFRDVMVWRFGLERGIPVRNELINADHSEMLQKFSGAFRTIAFDEIFGELERSIDLIDRNVQINLVLRVLRARLQRHLVVKKG
jgi:DNA polymerase III subunit delta'